MAEAALLALLYAQQFSVQLNTPINMCPIEFSREACMSGQHECDWHAFVQNTYHPVTRELTTKKIIINYNHWVKLDPVHRKELMYHELGHCALNLKHVSTIDIMRPRVYSTHKDGSNWDELVERMKATQ